MSFEFKEKENSEQENERVVYVKSVDEFVEKIKNFLEKYDIKYKIREKDISEGVGGIEEERKIKITVPFNGNTAVDSIGSCADVIINGLNYTDGEIRECYALKVGLFDHELGLAYYDECDDEEEDEIILETKGLETSKNPYVHLRYKIQPGKFEIIITERKFNLPGIV